jgi:hypothetical protein
MSEIACLQQLAGISLVKTHRSQTSHMTLKEVLDAVVPLDKEQRRQWVISLGSAMTIAARSGYPATGQADSTPHLMAFNELQHQLFGYLRHSQIKADWTTESFIEGLYQKAKTSGIEGDFGWALKRSIETIIR